MLANVYNDDDNQVVMIMNLYKFMFVMNDGDDVFVMIINRYPLKFVIISDDIIKDKNGWL